MTLSLGFSGSLSHCWAGSPSARVLVLCFFYKCGVIFPIKVRIFRLMNFTFCRNISYEWWHYFFFFLFHFRQLVGFWPTSVENRILVINKREYKNWFSFYGRFTESNILVWSKQRVGRSRSAPLPFPVFFCYIGSHRSNWIAAFRANHR